MKFKVKCPKCEGINAVEVDTGLANNGDVYNDVVECECGEAFILQTTITAGFDVLAVTVPQNDKNWLQKRQVKELLSKLEKLVQ